MMDSYNSSMSTISRRSLDFLGKGYEEFNRYANGGDYLQTSLTSGDVKKDDVFAGSLRSSTDEDAEKIQSRRETGYRVETGFVGIYSSTARFQNMNGSEVSDYYAGIMQLRKVMGTSMNYSFSRQEDGLPCCISSNTSRYNTPYNV